MFLGPLSEYEANSLGKEGIKVHPITAREKPNGNLRLITDASYPHEENDDEKGPASLNKFIDPDLYPTNMQGIPDFLSQLRNLGKDCKLAKADLADAYKHLHVRPEDKTSRYSLSSGGTSISATSSSCLAREVVQGYMTG